MKRNYFSKALGVLLIAVVFFKCTFAQEQKVNRADKRFDKYEYYDALKNYEDALEKGFHTEEVLKKIGDIYYFNAQYPQAAKYYKQLDSITDKITDPEYYFRLSQSLKALEQYVEADKAMEKFSSIDPSDSRSIEFNNRRNYLEIIEQESGKFKLDSIGGNSKLSDFAPTYYIDSSLVFSSTRDKNISRRNIDLWTYSPHYDLFSAKPSTDAGLTDIKQLKGINTDRYHESTVAFTKDGKTMYFTASRIYEDGKLKERGREKGNEVHLLHIYRASLVDGVWTNIKDLSINSKEFSTSAPALNPDNDVLYFASDMPEGEGETDLYEVAIFEDGTLGAPQNMGSFINTSGRENFPFVSKDNKLYFSSDGHYGLGGLDVYGFDLEVPSGGIINLGKPVSSSYDDLTFMIDSDTREGYMASNRPGGKGLDDIYQIKSLEQLDWKCDRPLAGTVRDAKTGELLSKANINLLSSTNGTPIAQVQTDANGYYIFDKKIDCRKKFIVRATLDIYKPQEKTLEPSKTDEAAIVDFRLEKDPIKEQENLLARLGIHDIYFDFDKYNIRKSSEADLDRVIRILNKYSKINIEIHSYTDKRGGVRYNQKLSDRRARATYNYLVKKGISKNRLTYKGFGLTNPKVICNPCTEAQYQQNRRSEFIALFNKK